MDLRRGEGSKSSTIAGGILFDQRIGEATARDEMSRSKTRYLLNVSFSRRKFFQRNSVDENMDSRRKLAFEK